ncbi:MAG: membrane dipeptidase [Bacteroidota bacterium]|nr:membrane dipeptidase [Bacteroidota bacterium]MDP3432670.1 membrane dipeptidase [Bacteroidota bacterium]
MRYITLCHSYHNDICDSSSDPKPAEHNGVGDFGKQVIAEMNRLGTSPANCS